MAGGQFQFFFLPATWPKFPQIFAAAPALVGPNVVYFDSHFQAPQIYDMELHVERELGWNTVLSLSYLGSLGRSLPDFVDTNIDRTVTQPITYSVVGGGPITSPTYTTNVYVKRLNTAFGSMTDIFSGISSSYNALTVQAMHRLSHNVQFSANYTWSHSLDFGQNASTFTDTNDLLAPNTIRAEYGNSNFNVPNRFVANAIVNSPWHVKGWLGYLANEWELAPIYQIFFFSSRRRHTRFKCDWSSDGVLFRSTSGRICSRSRCTTFSRRRPRCAPRSSLTACPFQRPPTT